MKVYIGTAGTDFKGIVIVLRKRPEKWTEREGYISDSPGRFVPLCKTHAEELFGNLPAPGSKEVLEGELTFKLEGK